MPSIETRRRFYCGSAFLFAAFSAKADSAPMFRWGCVALGQIQERSLILQMRCARSSHGVSLWIQGSSSAGMLPCLPPRFNSFVSVYGTSSLKVSLERLRELRSPSLFGLVTLPPTPTRSVYWSAYPPSNKTQLPPSSFILYV